MAATESQCLPVCSRARWRGSACGEQQLGRQQRLLLQWPEHLRGAHHGGRLLLGPPATKLTRWEGVAKALQADIKSDPDLARSAWPCMKRFLLGGPQCDASCKACQKDGGRGDEPSRARARAKLASIVAAGGLETDVRTALKAGERSRA